MKLFYSDHFVIPLPPGHRFPMSKYALLRERVVESRLVPPDCLLVPPAAGDEQIQLVHDPEYVSRVVNGTLSEKEMRRIGFPWSPEVVERSRRSVGGTIAAARAALEDGMAANLAGGTHHAYRDHGEGYCIFNDVAIAFRVLQTEGRIQRALVIDCDVHQGNGTAAIFAGDDSVFTFSIHGQKNFPYHKENGSLDIALPDGSGDAVFLDALAGGLEQSIAAARADLAFYIAGADPYRRDQLGRLSISKAGLQARDRLVFSHCERAALPVTIVMGGGYSQRVQDTVDIHFATLRGAVERMDGRNILSDRSLR